jgi:hypothetical protein
METKTKEKRETRGKAVKKSDGGKARASPAAAAAMAAKEGAQSFLRLRPEIDAVSLAGRGRIMVSIPVAVKIGVGALPNIVARFDEFRRRLPEYNVERASRLLDYARAAHYAHIVVNGVNGSEGRVRAILEEASPLRERMLSAGELHALYGLLDGGRVAGIRRGTGHLDTANDLVDLSVLFGESMGKLAGQTPVTQADIERAGELGFQLLVALGQRDQGTDGASTPAKQEEDRLKAFWLYHDIYEESRQAMTYVRWREGDADQLTPSLFSGRRRRGSSSDEPDDEPVPVESPDPVEGDPSESQ